VQCSTCLRRHGRTDRAAGDAAQITATLAADEQRKNCIRDYELRRSSVAELAQRFGVSRKSGAAVDQAIPQWCGGVSAQRPF
jgi:hypothetical protein